MKRLQKVEVSSAAESTAMDIATAGTDVGDAKRVNQDSDDINTLSPQKKILKNSGPPTPIPANTTPESVKPSPKKDPAALEAVKLDRDARALNMSLEFSLQFTLRPEAAVDSIQYIGQPGTPSALLNATNISELICSRLTEHNENAVAYLTGCYKRIVAKESSVSPGIVVELAK